MKLQSQRPNNLNEFVGKTEIKNNFKVYLKAAIINKQPLDHCLFYGLPGTGKTSLALLLANERNTKISIIQGSNIQKPIDVYNFALTIKENDIIFIDEIHAINHYCFELLYSLMEDFSLDITIGKDFSSKTTRIAIPKFTLIGATTSLSKIPKPLEERFGIICYFEDYNEDEIYQIIDNSCSKNDIKLTVEEKKIISSKSKGIPRNALTILSRVSDFKLINQKAKIEDILSKIGIYENGLNKADLKYLNCFKDSKQIIGLKTLSQLTNFEIQYIEEKIEPFLFKNNYVQKTAKGRIILPNGWNLMKKIG